MVLIDWVDETDTGTFSKERDGDNKFRSGTFSNIWTGQPRWARGNETPW